MRTHRPCTTPQSPETAMRIDKWLWAARFYKTRALAADEVGKGRVRLNGVECKPGRDIRPGDQISLRQGVVSRSVVVRALSHQRGPAPQAQMLYAETPESVAHRQALAEQRRLAPEPAQSLVQGRPTKRDRRQLQRSISHGNADSWGNRWSARLDGDNAA